MRPLKLGIDATNIRTGGGITHLSQLLHAAEVNQYDIRRVIVWAGKSTLEHLPEYPWLEKQSLPWMDSRLPRRLWGQQFEMPRLLRKSGCDVLFSPGGTVPGRCPVPIVTMSQNMLPFEPAEAMRFGRWSPMRLKMRMLRVSQGHSFKQADGLIFLTHYAHDEVSRFVDGLKAQTALIPHGIEARFLQEPRRQRLLSECSIEDPFRVLYVSILMPYKHQLQVAKAAAQLRAQGLPIEMRFVGASWGAYGESFRRLLQRLDPHGIFLKWSGHEPFETLHRIYQHTDAFVFASSCENLPNILLEAMAAGLPIACARRGPMPEVLQDAGLYFDPEDVDSIADAIRGLARDPELRGNMAKRAYELAGRYSWQRCAKETFDFIGRVARTARRIQ